LKKFVWGQKKVFRRDNGKSNSERGSTRPLTFPRSISQEQRKKGTIPRGKLNEGKPDDYQPGGRKLARSKKGRQIDERK